MRPTRSVLPILLIAASNVTAQDVSKSRIEREATGQAIQADALFKAGNYTASLKLFRAERESRKAIGDARYEGYAVRGIGVCLVRLGDDESAVDAFAEARSIDATREDKGFEGYDGLLMAQAQMRLGRRTDAVETLGLALPKLSQAVDRDHECDARLCLAAAFLELGKPDDAIPQADRTIALAEELHDPRRLADAWFSSGLVAKGRGEFGLAAERIEDARAAYREQDRPIEIAKTTRQLADLAVRLGHPRRAARKFAESAADHAKLGDAAAEADDRLDLASVRLDLGESEASVREASLARDAYLALGDDSGTIEALVVLAEAQSRTDGGLAAATDSIDVAVARSTNVFRESPADRVRLLLLSAELEHRRGRRDRVATRLEEASAVATKAKERPLIEAIADARARLKDKP